MNQAISVEAMHKFYFFLTRTVICAIVGFVVSSPSPLLAQAQDAAPFHNGIEIANNISGAHAVTTADLDQDGDLDVIAVGREGGQVVWFANDGGANPQFSANPIDIVTGAYDVYAVDLDRDGDLDIVVPGVGELIPSQFENASSSTPGEIIWFENTLNAGGGFVRHSIAGGLLYPVFIHADDLDRDGDADVLVTARDGNMALWYENNGQRPPSFTQHVISSSLPGAASVHVGDLDKDGDLDVIVAAERIDKIAWYANDGARPPNFTEHVIRQLPAAGDLDYAKAVFAADLDGDGDLDIAYASEGNNRIGWLQNVGGAPPAFVDHVLTDALAHAKMVIASDVDDDGDMDLLAASSGNDTIAWLENDGQPAPTFTLRLVNTAADGAHAVHAADLDGDGDTDLLSASREDYRIIWYPNRTIHRSALFPATTQYIIATHHEARAVFAADMDRDGDLDMLSVSSRNIAWHENIGGSPPSFLEHIIANDLNGGRLVYGADLDNDGDIDIAVASRGENAIYWYENLGGTPLAFRRYRVTNQALGVRAVLAADLDGDGDIDLYSASDTDNAITWYENLGGPQPSFTRHVVTNNAAYARSVYAADMDNDGDIDLVSASQADNKVSWYENLGGAPGTPPAFAEHVVVTNADGAQHIHTDDIDGDGDQDIVVAAERDNAIYLYENLGRTAPGVPVSFATHLITNAAPAVHAVYTGDADGDGDIDIFAAIEANNTIAWYENMGDGSTLGETTFVEHVIVRNALVAHGIHADDMDGDGDLDILSASREDGKIAWYENVGGQYALTTHQDIPGATLGIVVSHRGRSGDANMEITSFEFEFVDAAGAALSNEQASRLVQALHIYRFDCCEGGFDPSASPLIASVSPLALDDAGRQIVAFLDDDPALQIPAGGVVTYAVLVKTQNNGCQIAPDGVYIKHIMSSRIAHDADNNLPLLAEYMPALHRDSVPMQPQTPALMINEFMASNENGLADPNNPGEFPDWIELYNASSSAIDLGGKYLTDDLADPYRYQIPPGVIIPARGFLLFYADGEPWQGALHTNFKLEKDGEMIALIENTGGAAKLLDERVFGKQTSNVSEGRYPNGSANWQALGVATPGKPNMNQLQTAPLFLPLITYALPCP